MTDATQTPIDLIDPVPEPKARKRANGKALTVATDAPAPVVTSDGDAFLAMIERAARDPQVDIDKMERLFAMRERMQAQQAKAAYLAALAEMQPKLPAIDKRGEINIGSGKPQKYALWEDINEAIRPILAAHGFSLTHRISQTQDRMSVTAVLGHCAGHTEETSISLPIDATGSKNNVQGWGSSAQYGRRYTGVTILNITTRGEDDDGKAAGAGETITDAQYNTIMDLITATQSDTERFCRYMGVEGVAKIPASKYQRAVEALNAKRRK